VDFKEELASPLLVLLRCYARCCYLLLLLRGAGAL
jgi:hypothetical protein